MSFQVESPPLLSTKRLEGSIVAPRSISPLSKRLPNHLTDTKSFSSQQKHAFIKTKPSDVHFSGYTIGEHHQQTLYIMNCSNDNMSVHIIPPTTKFFSIQYHKQRSSVVPGLSLPVTIIFKPNEFRYYYDCIRIHCQGNQNLLVPIHAYPVLKNIHFPREVSFPATPIGQSRCHTIRVHSKQAVEFDFQLSFVQPHPAFTASPMQGVILANGSVDIKVIFTPVEFSTAIMKLQMDTSQFNFKPLVCTFTGSSTPGLAVEQYKEQQQKQQHQLQHLHQQQLNTDTSNVDSVKFLAPLDRLREKRRKKKRDKELSSEQGVLFEGIRFPPNLNTPSAVAKVLTQEAGQLKASELKKATSLGGMGVNTRQMKEALFLQSAKKAAIEEQSMKLKWTTQLGSSPMLSSEKEIVLKDREKCHDVAQKDELNRISTTVCKRRTRRTVGCETLGKPLFDLHANEYWRLRYNALNCFMQGVSKVIVRLRCEKRLKQLRILVSNMKENKEINLRVTDTSETQMTEPESIPSFTILPKTLPWSIEAKLNDKLPTTKIPVEPTQVDIPKDPPPLLKLRVPLHYELMGYTPLPLPARGSYFSPGLARPLLTGAEDECNNLTPIPDVDPYYLRQPGVEHDREALKVEDVEEDISKEDELLPLVPPPALLQDQPLRYHPLHIFAPCPELLSDSYRPLLPNSEVTLEHHLLPLATPTSAPHSQPKLDPKDGIPELMKWKQFPSQVLVSLNNQKKLSSLWKPRLSDPFLPYLLPVTTPSSLPLELTGPLEDDIVADQTEGHPVIPTRDMLKEEFYLPTTTASADETNTRETSMKLLSDQQKSQFGELGERISQKIAQLMPQLSERHYDHTNT